MVVDIDRYTQPNLQYRFTSGPEVVRTFEDAFVNGINCVSLAHLVLKDTYGLDLPSTHHSYEMFHDTKRFERLPIDRAQPLDLVWFGTTNDPDEIGAFQPEFEGNELVNWNECPVKHVGVLVGTTEGGEPEILHATDITRGVVVWPLGQFALYGRYKYVCGVSRVNTIREFAYI